MQIQITGRHMDTGDALKVHVQEAIEAVVEKYIGRSAEASVTFGKTNAKDGDTKGREFACEITLHLASGVFLNTEGNAADAHAAFDEACEKLDKRVRRYKRRLKDHHTGEREELPAESASSYVIQAPSLDEEETEDPPLIIAEAPAKLRRMTVSDAVVQLDLGREPVVMFRNAASESLCVVYRREDGNIGWIDAQGLGQKV
jgi:ribosomal subunit interface protein